jgi:N-acetylmuramoyl-L-alanine amidase
MKYTWILDNGHGGINSSGLYDTCPNWTYDKPEKWNKMFVHGKKPMYEGVFNRQIVDQIARKLTVLGIQYITLVPEGDDISLYERVRRANKIYEQNKNCIFVSVHGNAFSTKAKGFELFTSIGPTRSDRIADVFAGAMERRFPSQLMRHDLSDGDLDKEANFYVLKHTKMPAILTENYFFDNLENCKIMMSPEGQDKISQAHVDAIVQIEKQGGY